MTFARWWFGIAFLYGMAAVLPLYPRDPGPAPAFYYGFVGAAGATQLLYALIAADPRRFRPAIWVGIASKLSFALPCLYLHAAGLLPRGLLVAAGIDLLLAAGFLTAWVLLGRDSSRFGDAGAASR